MSCDKRQIIIHYLPSFPCPAIYKDYYIQNITISLYYLSKDNFEDVPEINRKEGYIIIAQIEGAINPKIGEISKKDFDKIFDEIKNINFESLAIDGYNDDDSETMEIEIGISGHFNSYGKKLKITVPNERYYNGKNDDGSELSKLLKAINEIKSEINFDSWYGEIYKKWYEWRKHLSSYYDLFREIE